jgi:hypothetical protein
VTGNDTVCIPFSRWEASATAKRLLSTSCATAADCHKLGRPVAGETSKTNDDEVQPGSEDKGVEEEGVGTRRHTPPPFSMCVCVCGTWEKKSTGSL